MAISQRRYVDIVSAVIGAGGTPQQKQDGRVFTTDEKVGLDEVLEFYDAKEVINFFGLNSEEGKFATEYFAVTTPAPVSRAKALQFARHDTTVGTETMLEAWLRVQELSDSYFSCFFLSRGDLEECTALSNVIAAENVKHQLFLQVSKAEQEAFSIAMLETASTGLISNHNGVDYLAHLPMALMSATDYNRANATMNYMFRKTGTTTVAQVTSSQDANIFDPLRVNYYGQTAVAGSDIRFFQRAFLCGNATAPLDMSVHANEQWLKARFTSLWFDLLMSTRGIPANLDGKARATQVITQVISEAIRNGVILRGKEISVIQKIAITDASADENAWIEVANNGAWFSVDIRTRTGEAMIEEYYLDYVLVYAKGDWVRKISGSHNLV